ncbi:MAG: VanZ family protein [Deltaproteobacteria bacterium]|nr:VanZ family protein [Deltaproteobacteria bacterium]
MALRGAAWRWGPAVAWAALILFLGSRPIADLPLPAFPGLDKALHASIYGVLGFLAVRGLETPGPWRALAWGAVIGFSWGFLDEWAQSATPNRTAELGDLLADVAGAAAGGWLAFRTSRVRARSQV